MPAASLSSCTKNQVNWLLVLPFSGNICLCICYCFQVDLDPCWLSESVFVVHTLAIAKYLAAAESHSQLSVQKRRVVGGCMTE